MVKIAILGCGQIGSRHLQSLALLDEPAEIHLVDPLEQSLQTAEAHFTQAVVPESADEFRLVRHRSTDLLPKSLDIAIVASSSMQRATLCEDLIAASEPRFIILEKFLFPRVVDFARIENLLIAKRIPAYVNQWLAATDAFLRIATDFLGSPVQMRVSGTGWGLCCNAVHYIEPFQYLTGRKSLSLERTDFLEGFQDSKRSGYREIFGELAISTADGSCLQLSCDPGPAEDAVHIDIANSRQAVAIEFCVDRFVCRFKGDGQIKEATLPIPMQSQLTHLIIRDLLSNEKCRLPELATSSTQHLLVLNAFLDHFRKSDPSVGEICPIT
jgi:hypothetical protein